MHRLGRVLALGVTVLAASTALPLTASAAAVSAAPDQWRGAQLHVMWDGSTDGQIDQQLDQLAAMHSNSARLDVAWSSLEIDGRGQWSTSYAERADHVIDGMNARGIKPVIVLTATPCWASSAPTTLKQSCAGDWWNRGVTSYAPTDPAYFGEAAAWVAQRWSTKLAGLELWNEPNYDEGGLVNLIAQDKAATYTAMVKAAYPAVKAVAADLPVLAGSTSFVDVPFLQKMWADGAVGYFDGLAVHPYNEWRAPGAPHDVEWAKYDLVQGLSSLRSAMTGAGVDVPIWITEFGYTSCTVGADRWCVTEREQADYLAQAAELVATWPWVRSFLVYNLRDKGTDPTSTEDNFGLDNYDLSPKPALGALGAAFGALANGAPATDSQSLTAAAPDQVAPVVKVAPRKRFSRSPRTVWKWSGHDRGSKVASYDVRYRVARWGRTFGDYRHPRQAQHINSSRLVAHVRRGSEMCVSVRARDGAGNSSDWTRDVCKTTVTRAHTAGAVVQRRHARGRDFSIVATRCPRCGRVDVWVGRHLIARKVSLHASTIRHRRIIRLPALNHTVSGTLRVRSTTQGRRVSIDGFGARRR